MLLGRSSEPLLGSKSAWSPKVLSESQQAAGWLQPCALRCALGVGCGGGSSEHSKASVSLDLWWKQEFSSLASKVLWPQLGCHRGA